MRTFRVDYQYGLHMSHSQLKGKTIQLKLLILPATFHCWAKSKIMVVNYDATGLVDVSELFSIICLIRPPVPLLAGHKQKFQAKISKNKIIEIEIDLCIRRIFTYSLIGLSQQIKKLN